MDIYSGSTVATTVNQVGRYIYENTDGAFDYVKHPNMCDVYFKMLYEVPKLQRIPGKQKEGYNDLHEIVININITTYQNKIRVNTIEMSPLERTLGYDLYDPIEATNLDYIRRKILQRVIKRVSKAYAQYDFVF